MSMSETTLRRRAVRLGYTLHKVREGSRDWWAYGPWCITTDDSAGVVASRLDLDEVAAWLTEREG